MTTLTFFYYFSFHSRLHSSLSLLKFKFIFLFYFQVTLQKNLFFFINLTLLYFDYCDLLIFSLVFAPILILQISIKNKCKDGFNTLGMRKTFVFNLNIQYIYLLNYFLYFLHFHLPQNCSESFSFHVFFFFYSFFFIN